MDSVRHRRGYVRPHGDRQCGRPVDPGHVAEVRLIGAIVVGQRTADLARCSFAVRIRGCRTRPVSRRVRNKGAGRVIVSVRHQRMGIETGKFASSTGRMARLEMTKA